MWHHQCKLETSFVRGTLTSACKNCTHIRKFNTIIEKKKQTTFFFTFTALCFWRWWNFWLRIEIRDGPNVRICMHSRILRTTNNTILQCIFDFHSRCLMKFTIRTYFFVYLFLVFTFIFFSFFFFMRKFLKHSRFIKNDWYILWHVEYVENHFAKYILRKTIDDEWQNTIVMTNVTKYRRNTLVT